jgi:STE24 endopeptidase
MEEIRLRLDPDRQRKASQYARIRRGLWAFDRALSLGYLSLWVALGWGIQARVSIPELISRLIPSLTIPWWGTMLLIAALMGGPITLITLPLSYYRGFRLPHRFGQSTHSLQGWITDQLKGLLLSLIVGIPLLIGLFLLLRNFPNTWWVWAGAAFTLVTTVLAALAPLLILPLFFNPQPLREEYQELEDRLLKLARSADTRVRGVYKLDMSRRTKSANAALMGIGRTRRILLGDTLLEEFEPVEIETILAHEIAHHVHGDIPRGILVQGAMNLLGFFLVHQLLSWIAPKMSFAGSGDPALLPLLSLVFTLGGLASMPLSNAYSRWRERLADSFALDLTGKAQAFADAMTRLANQNLAQADPPAWDELLFYSHPSLRKRLDYADKWAEANI